MPHRELLSPYGIILCTEKVGSRGGCFFAWGGRRGSVLGSHMTSKRLLVDYFIFLSRSWGKVMLFYYVCPYEAIRRHNRISQFARTRRKALHPRHPKDLQGGQRDSQRELAHPLHTHRYQRSHESHTHRGRWAGDPALLHQSRRELYHVFPRGLAQRDE